MTAKGRTIPLACKGSGKKAVAVKAGKPGTTDEERRSYWAAKQVAASAAKAKSRKERSKLRAAARKSAKAGFTTGRAKDRRPTHSETAQSSDKKD